MYVVVAHECHLLSVGRPYGRLLRSVVGQLLQLAASYIIYVVYCREGATVYFPRLCLYEQLRAVGAHYIVFKRAYLLAHRIIHVEEHVGLLSRPEQVSYYFLSVLAHLGIRVTVVESRYATQSLGSELSRSYILQRQLVACNYCRHAHYQGGTHHDYLFHTIILFFSSLFVSAEPACRRSPHN